MEDAWQERGSNAGIVTERTPSSGKYSPEFTKEFIVIAVYFDIFLNGELIESPLIFCSDDFICHVFYSQPFDFKILLLTEDFVGKQ